MVTMDRMRQPKIRIAWWLVLLQSILVRYVRISDVWLERVRGAAAKGPVLFVLRNRSLIDFLCLQGLMRKHNLPEVGYVTGLSPFLFFPLLHMLFALFFPRRREVSDARLNATLTAGGCAVIFLRRPALRGAFGSRPVKEDGIRTAVTAQGIKGYHLMALPTVFLWGESALRRMPGTMDFLFGSNEYPRLLRAIWLLLRRRSVHELHVAPPLDVATIRDERRIGDDALSSVIRAGVGKRIEIIRRAKLGALTKPSTRIMTEVHKSGRLKGQLVDIARDTGVPISEIDARSWAIIKKMAADFRPRVVGIFGWVMTFVWKRIYTGIDIRREDIEKMRTVMGERATLLLPSHKSHIDYLVLSQIMKENNLMMPHIAAGQNLSFWPLGWIFRSSGAFFIRRRFINDRFYTAVVGAYVRRLLQERYAIEVFIEGGRSRTGKLLQPKTGMLDMSLKAVALSKGTDLNVLPIFIGYEHVIEEQAYIEESGGRPKKAENISGLIRTTTVLFRKFGRLHVRVGQPFSVSAMLREHGMSPPDLMTDSIRRSFAKTVGLRNMVEINRITVATSSSILATVLLTHDHDSIPHDILTRDTRWMAAFLKIKGVAISKTVEGWCRDDADSRLDRAARVFVKIGRIYPLKRHRPESYGIPKSQRQSLDYYKNNIIHFWVPASLIAGSLLIHDDHTLTLKTLSENMSVGCRLYHREFFLPLDDSNNINECVASAHLVEQTLDHLTEAALVRRDSDGVKGLDPARLRFLANVLRNYHEVYFATLQATRAHQHEPEGPSVADLVERFTQQHFMAGLFKKTEGHTAWNRKSARETLKALKISRPEPGNNPFETGALGNSAILFLEKILRI